MRQDYDEAPRKNPEAAPSSKIYEAWQAALKDPQTRRRIEESPHIPDLLMLTGKIDVEREGVPPAKLYVLRIT